MNKKRNTLYFLHIQKHLLCFCFLLFLFGNIKSQDGNDSLMPEIFTLSIEELINLEVASTSLTKIKNNLKPSPSITITQNDIQVSGARNLDELLEIYVPGFFMLYKGQTSHSIGVRGLISDRNNKVILLVNGRIMNEKTLMGAFTERTLSMLNDIDKIEVIQSPKSSLYGPGAISFIISIYTKSADRNGNETAVEISQGAIDNYTAIQARHANKIKEDFSYSVYLAAEKDLGVSNENAPTLFAFNAKTIQGDTIKKYEPIEAQYIPNLNSAPLEEVKYKSHAEVTYKNFKTWARLTKGGMGYSKMQQILLNSNPSTNDTSYTKYKQFTLFSEYDKKWKKVKINTRLSYDSHNRSHQEYTEKGIENSFFTEKEIYSRVIFEYDTDKLSIAAGPAVSIETFGLPSKDVSKNTWKVSDRIYSDRYQEALDLTDSLGQEWADSVKEYGETWTTKMLSGIVEAQLLIFENMSIVSGIRIDKHDYTKEMISPRIAVILKPSISNLIRFQYNRSNRRNDDRELRLGYLTNKTYNKKNESIDFYELSGDFKINHRIAVKPSIYYVDYDHFGWDWRTHNSKFNGNLKYAGAELTAVYHSSKSHFQLSHNYIQQLKFALPLDEDGNPTADNPSNNMTILGGGYSNSFRNYPDHLTKLNLQHKLNEKMIVSSSLQVTWYLQGAHDGALYQEDILAEKTAIALEQGNEAPSPAYHQAYTEGEVYEQKRVRAFKPSAYMQVGYIYNINKYLKASLYGYNLLGIINKDLNKRTEFQRNSMYRIQPVAFSAKVNFSF